MASLIKGQLTELRRRLQLRHTELRSEIREELLESTIAARNL